MSRPVGRQLHFIQDNTFTIMSSIIIIIASLFRIELSWSQTSQKVRVSNLIVSGRENSASFYRREGSCFWLFSPWWLIGHALRAIFMLWLLKIWQVGSCGKFMHYRETCLVIAEADSFVSSYSCTKWKTAAIKILLLFMAGLFIGFLVEKCAAFPSHRKSVFW